MLKKLIRNGKKKVFSASVAVSAMALSATSAFAANPDLDDVAGTLLTGVEDLKLNAMQLVVAILAVILIIFGISWLINIFKKKMSKA